MQCTMHARKTACRSIKWNEKKNSKVHNLQTLEDSWEQEKYTLYKPRDIGKALYVACNIQGKPVVFKIILVLHIL